MANLPEALAIAFWLTGTCWALALIAYLFGASTEWVFPLFLLGCLTGLAEWFIRRETD